ncbi:MAG: response regulator transcription factor [Alphaproteobacteria bacterium]|nr:response regulator transcription factor [Alphaproteobacteria bacterium]
MNKAILIIDDDAVLRVSLAKGLRQNGFNVVTADSAETAGKILERLKFDAIILDRMMTGVDGLTALRQWRSSNMTAPVIMLTALSGSENAIAGLEGGADDYLAKPFSLKELILRLNNAMKISVQVPVPVMPKGLKIVDGEFFVGQKLLALSTVEKKLLSALTLPTGSIVAAAPMTAKRLREKLSAALPCIDILTIRGKGYKLVPVAGR